VGTEIMEVMVVMTTLDMVDMETMVNIHFEYWYSSGHLLFTMCNLS
jgi:hypothetical protein